VAAGVLQAGLFFRVRTRLWRWGIQAPAEALAVYIAAFGILLTALLLMINRRYASTVAMVVHPIAAGILLALLLLGIGHSAETLIIHPAAVGFLQAAFFLRIDGRHGTETLIIHPAAVGFLQALLSFRIGHGA
jgi:hydrogenase-4 membrane subunit HyfE